MLLAHLAPEGKVSTAQNSLGDLRPAQGWRPAGSRLPVGTLSQGDSAAARGVVIFAGSVSTMIFGE